MATAIEDARSSIKLLEARVGDAQGVADALAKTLDERRVELDNAASKRAEAETAYATSPNESTAAAVARASEAHRLEEIRHASAQKKFADASSDVTSVRSKLDDANAALANAEQDIHLEGLRQRAASTTFHARAKGPALRMLAALDALRDSATELDAAFADANDAAAEHTASGAGQISPLSEGHVLLDLVEALTERGVVVSEHDFTNLRSACAKGPHVWAKGATAQNVAHLAQLLLRLLERGPAPAEHAVQLAYTKRRNAHMRATRTLAEAHELEAAHGKAEAEERMKEYLAGPVKNVVTERPARATQYLGDVVREARETVGAVMRRART